MLEQRLYIIRLCSRSYFFYLSRPDMSFLSARTCVPVVFYVCRRYVPKNGDVHRNYLSSFSPRLYLLVERRRRKNPAMYVGNNLFHVITVVPYIQSICWWCGLLLFSEVLRLSSFRTCNTTVICISICRFYIHDP